VAVTDYPGLGTPGNELYAVNEAEGYAVLDVLKAALNLAPAQLSPRTPVAIEGYSQGGGAAAFAAQEAPTYARSLDLLGVAMGGTPANLQAVANNINGGAFFAFLGGAAIGFDAAYPQLHFGQYLTSTGKQALKALSGMCQEQGLVTYAGKSIQDYTKGGIDPLTLPPIEQVLNDNDAGGVAPEIPVLQYHGLADEVIPYSVEVSLHDAWCSLGATSDLVSFPGDHVTTQVEAQVTVAQWISNRFSGAAAPSSC
jgi:pimeloyl-ACP methyl ester carboxylesterase